MELREPGRVEEAPPGMCTGVSGPRPDERGGAQTPGSKMVTQLPAPRGASDSGLAGHMERGSLVAWEASGKCGEMAVHSFTAQQQLVVTMFV